MVRGPASVLVGAADDKIVLGKDVAMIVTHLLLSQLVSNCFLREKENE